MSVSKHNIFIIQHVFPESISYSEFCEIMKQEKQNSKNDLVYAFKKMDINDDGFISFSELKKALTMVNIIVTACNSPGASCSILH